MQACAGFCNYCMLFSASTCWRSEASRCSQMALPTWRRWPGVNWAIFRPDLWPLLAALRALDSCQAARMCRSSICRRAWTFCMAWPCCIAWPCCKACVRLRTACLGASERTSPFANNGSVSPIRTGSADAHSAACTWSARPASGYCCCSECCHMLYTIPVLYVYTIPRFNFPFRRLPAPGLQVLHGAAAGRRTSYRQ